VFIFGCLGIESGEEPKRGVSEIKSLIGSFPYCKFRIKLEKKLKLVLKQINMSFSDIKPDAVEIFTTEFQVFFW
jgi:hypothetical protein